MWGIKEKCHLLVEQAMEQDKLQRSVESGPAVRRREVPIWAWLAVIAYMVLADNLFPSGYEGWALAVGWFVAGTLCLVNYNSCGRYHCKITGPGLLGIGILVILEALGIVSMPGWVTFTSFIAVLAAGFGLEYRYRSECGTCYIMPRSK